MKIRIAALLLAWSAMILPVSALKPGDAVTPDALGKLDWVQGTAPAQWEPGKLYLIESWTLSSQPCLAIIPHTNSLHRKFSGRGLRVIGIHTGDPAKQDAKEVTKEDLVAFIKRKAPEMAYPAAISHKDSAFETTWLKPAGVDSLPQAFLVRDGKLLLGIHPVRLDDQIIVRILAGGTESNKAIEELSIDAQTRESIDALTRAYKKASQKNDVSAMEKALEELNRADKAGHHARSIALDLALVKKDWPTVGRLMTDESGASMALTKAATAAATENAMPPALVATISAKFASVLTDRSGPSDHQLLSRIQWRQGNKDAAIASALKAAEIVKEPRFAHARLPAAPFEKFADALKAGHMPTREEFRGWMKASQPKPE